VRFRTAAILSVLVIGGLWGFPAAVWAIFLPSLRQGLPVAIPGYERLLLEAAVFCGRVKWFATFPLIGALFAIAGFSVGPGVRK
jgi:hypothetical protein